MARENGIPGFALTRLAPAKVNLALHVVGQRPDGYHLLESLVTFADAGDRVGFSHATDDRFTVSGRFSTDLPLTGEGASGNLVLRARDLLRAHLVERDIAAGPVHLHLEKTCRSPPASVAARRMPQRRFSDCRSCGALLRIAAACRKWR